MSFRRLLALTALAGAGLALSTPGHALTTRCVGTPQQLASALAEAHASTDSIFIVKMRTGTYQATSATGAFQVLQKQDNQTLELSGGWTGPNGSCQSLDRDPSLTVIQGTHELAALKIGAGLGSGGTVYAHGFTLTNPNFVLGLLDPICLFANVTAGNTLVMERMRVRHCVNQYQPQAYSAWVENRGGVVTLRSSWFSNGGVIQNALRADSEDQASTRISHLTVTGSGVGLTVGTTTGGALHLENSVSWGNVTDVLASRGANSTVTLRRVHYGTLEVQGPALNSNIAPGSGDPGFIGAGNPRLRQDSILVDSGVGNPVGGTGTYDADGLPRVQGVAPDVGAYEAAANQPPTIEAAAQLLLPSTHPVGALVYVTDASDDGLPGPTLSYSLEATGCPNLFAIGTDGKVRTLASIPAGLTACTLRARVSDGEFQTHVDTEVTVNRPPTLGSAILDIASPVAAGSVLHTFVANDDGVPQGNLTYGLHGLQTVPANLPSPFQFSTDGTLRLATPLPASAATYTLTIRVCDQGGLCNFGTLVVGWAPLASPAGGIFRDGFD